MQSKPFWYWWFTLIAQLPFIKSSPTSFLCPAENPLACLTPWTTPRPAHLGCSSAQTLCFFVSPWKGCCLLLWFCILNIINKKCSSLWWSLIAFPTFADVLQVVTRSRWFSFHCTEYVVLHNGSKGVEIRKAKTTSSLCCQTRTLWKSHWHKISSSKPKAPKGVAGTQQWYLQVSPTYTPWLALHTPR